MDLKSTYLDGKLLNLRYLTGWKAMKKLACRLFLFVFSCFLVACVTTNQAQVTMLHAPEVDAAATYRSISIAQFSGQMGGSVSTALEGAMMNAKVRNKPV